jgi:hypothetical protein
LAAFSYFILRIAMDTMTDTEHFSPYRADGKLYGFVCVVTGAQQAVGQAIIRELAGEQRFRSRTREFATTAAYFELSIG